MLKQKEFTENDIVTLKLSTSEEVFGRFKGKEQDGTIYLEKPLQLMPDQKGNVGLAPALHTAGYDITVAFKAQNIVAATYTEESLKNNYIQATTNIQPASQMPNDNTGQGNPNSSIITGS